MLAMFGTASVLMTWAEPAAQAQPKPARYELLLRNGHVIDPANRIDGRRDVAIADGKIAAVKMSIAAADAHKVIDAQGLYIAPGFIDVHAHIGFGNDGRPAHPPARYLASGTTTVVDAGSWGVRHLDFFRERFVEKSPVRVLAFLNIVSTGMTSEALEQDPALMDVEAAVAAIEKNRDIIVGIKSAHYWSKLPFDAVHQPWTSVDRALAAAGRTGVPIMVDFWPRPPERSYADLLARLRPGDIHTHVFAQQFPVLDEKGKVSAFMRQARERGVLFDLGHGAGSFWFRNAVPAIAQGFVPDTFGTDLHQGNLNGPVVDMQTTLGKVLSMGVSVARVVEGVTVNAARAIRRTELGTLSVGAKADVAVFAVEKGRFGYSDCGHASMMGKFRLSNRVTLVQGRVVYDASGLSMVPWQKAPPQYFTTPSLQSDAPAMADSESLPK